MSNETDDAREERARVIASALAHTSEHHRRTAVIAGVIALGGCVLAFFAEAPAAKATALGIGVIFLVFCYRATRSANAFLDPTASPVLAAIAGAPDKIETIVLSKASSVVKIQTRDAALEIRVDERTPAEPLLDALEAHAPHAEIQRE